MDDAYFDNCKQTKWKGTWGLSILLNDSSFKTKHKTTHLPIRPVIRTRKHSDTDTQTQRQGDRGTESGLPSVVYTTNNPNIQVWVRYQALLSWSPMQVAETQVLASFIHCFPRHITGSCISSRAARKITGCQYQTISLPEDTMLAAQTPTLFLTLDPNVRGQLVVVSRLL